MYTKTKSDIKIRSKWFVLLCCLILLTATATVDAADAEPIQSIAFVKDMGIRDALRLLAARYQKNIVPSSEVDGQLAFTDLKNVTFEEAMDAILGGKFEYEPKGNLIEVFRKGDKTRMKHAVFALHYISAEEAEKLIRPILSSDGIVGVTSPAETGVPTGESISAPIGGGDTMSLKDTIVIYDYAENIKRAEQLIKDIDVRPQQVLVEATILAATLTEDTQFGIDWDTLKGSPVTALTGISSGSPDYVKAAGTNFGGATAVSGGMTVGLAFGDVGVFIRAVEQVTDVTLLANPKILAVNKQLGQVYIGEKVGYREGDIETEGGGIQEGAVRFLDTGTKLSFRPYISDGGYIRMDIHTKDSTDQSSGGIPSENSAELVSNVMVRDGETIVIGGLFRDRVESKKTQVPLLGDLPIVGGLFKGTSDDFVRQEVIVLLTPHVVEGPEDTDGALREADISRKRISAREGFREIGRSRLAEEYYEKATGHYLNGEYDEAMEELGRSLGLRPTYLEAIQLQEKIISKTAPDDVSKIERNMIDAVERRDSRRWRRR